MTLGGEVQMGISRLFHCQFITKDNMKEPKFIGTLMPSHPGFQPIIQEIREKYQLPEVDLDGEPITEIYLGDEIIPLENFRQEIRSLVEQSTSYLPAEYANFYKGKQWLGKPLDTEGREIPDDILAFINVAYAYLQNMMKEVIPIIDAHYDSITNMIYIYLLTGETEEIPANWMTQVFTKPVMGNTLIYAVASQASDPEETVRQFRALYRKTFGNNHQPKLTKRIVSTAYYIQLRRLGKPWAYIVEEFIEREQIRLPRDTTSKGYFERKRKAEQLLKKRIQRAEGVLDVLLGDKN
jgi:hypothetical protein